MLPCIGPLCKGLFASTWACKAVKMMNSQKAIAADHARASSRTRFLVKAMVALMQKHRVYLLSTFSESINFSVSESRRAVNDNIVINEVNRVVTTVCSRGDRVSKPFIVGGEMRLLSKERRKSNDFSLLYRYIRYQITKSHPLLKVGMSRWRLRRHLKLMGFWIQIDRYSYI